MRIYLRFSSRPRVLLSSPYPPYRLEEIPWRSHGHRRSIPPLALGDHPRLGGLSPLAIASSKPRRRSPPSTCQIRSEGCIRKADHPGKCYRRKRSAPPTPDGEAPQAEGEGDEEGDRTTEAEGEDNLWGDCFCGIGRYPARPDKRTRGATSVWVACDSCGRWCHGECAGLSAAEAEALDAYMCPPCVDKDKARPLEFARRALTHTCMRLGTCTRRAWTCARAIPPRIHPAPPTSRPTPISPHPHPAPLHTTKHSPHHEALKTF